MVLQLLHPVYVQTKRYIPELCLHGLEPAPLPKLTLVLMSSIAPRYPVRQRLKGGTTTGECVRICNKNNSLSKYVSTLQGLFSADVDNVGN